MYRNDVLYSLRTSYIQSVQSYSREDFTFRELLLIFVGTTHCARSNLSDLRGLIDCYRTLVKSHFTVALM